MQYNCKLPSFKSSRVHEHLTTWGIYGRTTWSVQKDVPGQY